LTLAEDLRTAIEASLSIYDVGDGLGADAYCNADICHSMADGKYLQILAVLHQSKLISATQFNERSQRVCTRLESSALRCFDEGWGWGLGFSWRNLPATEPFLITSAIVCRGLLDCHNQGLAIGVSAKLLWKGRTGLEVWMQELALPVDELGISLPAYSPGIREPIYNAAAYAIGTLKLIKDAEGLTPAGASVFPAMEWIRDRRVDGLGWTYSPNSPVVDLLHQCYILNALADVFGIESIETASAEMVGQFAGLCCFADAMRLVMVDDEPANVRDIPWLRPLGRLQVELLPKPARLWSLGEILVLMSRLGLEGERSDAWVRQGRRVAESILLRLSAPGDAEAQFPRHVMHAVHGLVCYLALLRKRAQS
jgi:hypothetical protein